MLRTILGFDHELIIKYGLDSRDLILLDYVSRSFLVPDARCMSDEERSFVWIPHYKVVDDLAYLNISVDRVGKLLGKLVRTGLLEERSRCNDNLKGSRSYYRLTDAAYEMWSKPCKPAQTVEELKITLQGGVKNNSPSPYSNKQIDNTLNSKEANKQISQRAKKQSLYDKCIEQIEAFTEDERLKEALIQYLKGLLEICRAEKRPIYTNMFIGKLNRLKTFPEKDWLEIVELATSNGWKNFYSLQNNSTRSNLRQNTFNDKATSEHYTNEELKEIDRLNEERRKRGLRTEF